MSRSRALAVAIRHTLTHALQPVVDQWAQTPASPLRSLQDNQPQPGPALVEIAGLVLALAACAEHLKSPGYLEAALHACERVIPYWSEEKGAWQQRPHVAGQAVEGSVSTAAVCVAIAALADCGRLGRSPAWIDLAARSFETIWNIRRDPRYGAVLDNNSPAGTTGNRLLRLNTQIHALATCASLLAATGNALWKDRCRDLALLAVSRTFDPIAGCAREFLLIDGPEDAGWAADPVSIGDNLAAARALSQAATLVEEPCLADIADRVLAFSLEAAWVQQGSSGGFRSLVLTGSHSRSSEPSPPGAELTPWVQAEGLAALAIRSQARPYPHYLDRMESLWRLIERHGLDPGLESWNFDEPERSGIETMTVDGRSPHHLIVALLHAAASLDGSHPTGNLSLPGQNHAPIEAG